MLNNFSSRSTKCTYNNHHTMGLGSILILFKMGICALLRVDRINNLLYILNRFSMLSMSYNEFKNSQVFELS
jgi:hypothetical protein